MRSAALFTQNHLPKTDDLMPQNAIPLRKSPPWSPNTSTPCVSCTAPATRNASFQILFKYPMPAIVLKRRQNPHVLLTFDKVHNPLRVPRKTTSERSKVLRTRQFFWLRNVLRATTACTFSTSQLPKVLWTCCVLCILTWKCASRHNGVHFFNISTSKSALNQFLTLLTSKCVSCYHGMHFLDIATSKSGPTLVCFVHFDFQMCFAPQRRATFHFSSGQMAPRPQL